MKCYTHSQLDAIGMCKSCCKGLCLECSQDVGNGLACKNTCLEEVEAVNEIIARNKQLYSIGQKAPLIPSGAVIYIMFMLMFCGWSTYLYFSRNVFEPFSMFMGIGMGLIAVYVIYKNRKTQLNC